MKRHLTSKQISEWVSGDREAQLRQHVAECPACQSEIDELEGVLALFRASVHQSAAAELENAALPAYRPNRADVRAASVGRLYWGLAAAIVCLVLTLSVMLRRDRQADRDTASADATLLLQVDAALSREVPQPMEPLAKLVAWDGSPSATAQ